MGRLGNGFPVFPHVLEAVAAVAVEESGEYDAIVMGGARLEKVQGTNAVAMGTNETKQNGVRMRMWLLILMLVVTLKLQLEPY
mmetsp:Transcript_28631/g.68914  ORF Transcript_28631/g.68914 Transcript_28631/m.68914 type:complete len:83 (-) Transcript_28631:41-289(-)